ncbi:MAG: aspartyl protease family protein [Flavobacterium sp.]|uniref:aspartyl protease family protein n=1 Tax=Flavobacterium sp. TaxID=239 RepID=UPI0022CD13AD|nr:aspartyl protease family protein [Flavobacterium sp.]MCZ8198734.1 aspartyl protease family protein [Flavobacterium sp.]
MNLRIIIIFLFFACQNGFAQDGFRFDTDKNKVVIPFKLINNLIFIPINVNGVELNFLLDSGVEETILLSLEDKTEVSLNNVEKIKLKGLGANEAIEGLKSSGNILKINELKDFNHELYIVLDQDFNFSSHVGIPVNGIIGYHFFKNQIVEVNYDRKKIFVYKDKTNISNKLASKFQVIPMQIQKQKPYCNSIVTINDNKLEAKVLLDLGNSDALWLFQDVNPLIKVPKRNFEDYLGKGFSGEIHGNRAKIETLKIGNFEFKKPIVAMPDTISVKSVNMVQDRVGSIGGEIMKRFTAIFDYQESKLYLKKSGKFGEPFQYNRCGIEIASSGMQWVSETIKFQTTYQDNTFDASGNKAGSANFKYKFELKPIYEITNIRKNSPAIEVGLQKGDILKTINYHSVNSMSLSEINNLLKSEEGKWLNFEVERNGQNLNFRFQIKELL